MKKCAAHPAEIAVRDPVKKAPLRFAALPLSTSPVRSAHAGGGHRKPTLLSSHDMSFAFRDPPPQVKRSETQRGRWQTAQPADGGGERGFKSTGMNKITAMICLSLTLAACSTATPASGAFPCAAELASAAQYTEQVAEARAEQMKVMRFASETAMNAYIAETNRLESEAGRMRQTLVDLQKATGTMADYEILVPDGQTDEDVSALIAAADTCVANLKK